MGGNRMDEGQSENENEYHDGPHAYERDGFIVDYVASSRGDHP